MMLIETSVSDKSVWMRFADTSDCAKAAHWIDFQVPLSELKVPAGSGTEVLLGDPELQLLSEVRLAALRYVRDVIGAETRRLSGLRDRSS